jgi:uncharacterized membrane protein
MLLILEKALVYGHLGFLIEIWFTGIHSFFFRKDKSATAKTYLPMCLVYGIAALILESISQILPWPFYLKAFVYVLAIYVMEGFSGWVLKKLIGRIPWDYGISHWTPFGLINLKYAPFWLLVAMAFDPITDFLTKLLRHLSSVT